MQWSPIRESRESRAIRIANIGFRALALDVEFQTLPDGNCRRIHFENRSPTAASTIYPEKVVWPTCL